MFLQGNPESHTKNINDIIEKYINDIDLNIDFEFLGDKILYCNLYKCPNHRNLPLLKTYKYIFEHDNKDEYIYKYKNIDFSAGAQFIVSKKTILRKPIEFYINIKKLLDNSINPIEGFVIERFWKLIFLK
jgi:hypothetical protein